MLTRIRKSLSAANYGALGLELFLVIAGILIAFQIDRWAESRRDHQEENQYLIRLKEDLQSEIRVMELSIEYAAERLQNVHLLEEISDNPEIAKSRARDVLLAIEQVTWRSFPQIAGNVYGELKATGKLALIRSEQLRHDLWEYYTYYDHVSVIGSDLELQNLFTRLTAGLLSTAELTVIQGARTGRESWHVSSQRAYDVALQFAEMDDAIALLPSIAQHQIHNQRFVGSTIERARDIVNAIEAMLESDGVG